MTIKNRKMFNLRVTSFTLTKILAVRVMSVIGMLLSTRAAEVFFENIYELNRENVS